MTITDEDGSAAIVKICDEHAEEATIKSVKQAYSSRLEQIKLVIEQAKSLGLSISADVQPEQKIVVVKQQEQVVPVEPAVEKVTPKPIVDNIIDNFSDELDPSKPNVVPTSRLVGRTINSVAGSVGAENIQAYAGYSVNDLSEKLDEDVLDGYAEMVLNEGRAGQNVAIPAIRRDKTGTTRIVINKSENDATLQERSKRMAQASLSNDSMNFRDGYAGQRTCPLCRGVGFINQGKSKPVCPKCGGKGLIVVA